LGLPAKNLLPAGPKLNLLIKNTEKYGLVDKLNQAIFKKP
jgi:hypothetical protein